MTTDLELWQRSIAGVPTPAGAERITQPLTTPAAIMDRLRHFPPEVYRLDAESLLVRFLKVLLGDSGVGQLRKREVFSRLAQIIQGAHFWDLDRFWGALFGLPRLSTERLTFNPYGQLATRQQWEDARQRDAEYRARIKAFARAVTYGASPLGMELLAEAIIQSDVRIYEATDGERTFSVRPLRDLTLEERYALRRVLAKVSGVDSRFTIDVDRPSLVETWPLYAAHASSEYWEIVPEYQVAEGAPQPDGEQPRVPFSNYQGEAWSYIGDIAALSTQAQDPDGNVLQTAIADVVVTETGRILVYGPTGAIASPRQILAGRSASEGVQTTHPFPTPRYEAPASDPHDAPLWDTATTTPAWLPASPVYIDGIPVEDLVAALGAPDTAQQGFWATPHRAFDSDVVEVLEVRFRERRMVNYLAWEASTFPCRITTQAWSNAQGAWVDLSTDVIDSSTPERIPPQRLDDVGHPQHYGEDHWTRFGNKVAPISTKRVRFLLQRTASSQAPKYPNGDPVLYSLALRNVDIGYRVRTEGDVPRYGRPVGSTIDLWGNRIEYNAVREPAMNLVRGPGQWRCEPQPARDVVVNLYADLGVSRVVDQWTLDPLFLGPRFNLYWSDDPPSTGDFDANDDPVATPPVPAEIQVTTVQEATGINEVQTVTITADGGTFTVTFDGETTSALAYDITAGDLETALEGLSTIGAGNVAVTGGPGSPTGGTYTLTFVGDLSNTDVPQVTVTSALTLGTGTVLMATGQHGSATNEVQQIVVNADEGDYTLSFGGNASASIAWNASGPTVQSALEAVTGIGSGNVAVSRSGSGPYTYTVTFQGALAGTDVAQLTLLANNTGLGGIFDVISVSNGGATPEVQTVTVTADGGKFVLQVGSYESYDGAVRNPVATSPLAYNASAGTVQTALNATLAALPSGGNRVTVTGGPGSPSGGVYTLTFSGKLGNVNQTSAWSDVSDPLTNGTGSISSSVTTPTAGLEAGEVQQITITATSGTFRLTFNGYTTGDLAYNASAGTVQTALRALTSVGGANVNVTGSAGGPYTVTFTGELRYGDVPLITIDATRLFTGSAGSVSTATIVNGSSTNEQQRIVMSGAQGNWKINLKKTGGTTYTTALIGQNASAGAVRTALEALPNVGEGNVAVTKTGDYPANRTWDITFQGAQAGESYDQLTTTTPANDTISTLSNGSRVNEVQSLTVAAAAGYYTLTFGGYTTGDIHYAASAATVQAALAALTSVGSGNVVVSGGPGNLAGSSPYQITFQGALAGTNVALTTVGTNGTNTGQGTGSVATTAAEAGANEVQRIQIGGALSGTWTITFSGQTTTGIAVNASAATVASALNALSNIGGAGGSVSVTKATGMDYTVTFGGGTVRRTDVAQMTLSTGSLSVGGTIVSATTTPGSFSFEQQVLKTPLTPSGNYFVVLTFDGETTDEIELPGGNLGALSASDRQAWLTYLAGKINALPNIVSGESVAVTVSWAPPGTYSWGTVSTSENAYVISFVEATGHLATVNRPTLVVGQPGTVTITTTTQGAYVNERQNAKVTAVGGTFTLTYSTQTTDPIDFDASASEVQAHLVDDLSNIGSGDVVVTGGPGSPAGGTYVLQFQGALGKTNLSQVTADASSLDGPGSAAVFTTAQGLAFNETQRLQITAVGGTYSLDFDGEVTDPITFDPETAATDLLAALEALPNIDPGDLTVEDVSGFGSLDRDYRVTFGGQYAGDDVPLLQVVDNSLVVQFGFGVDVGIGEVAEGFSFTDDASYVELGNDRITFDGERNWWFGARMRMRFASVDPTPRQQLDFGVVRLITEPGKLVAEFADGTRLEALVVWPVDQLVQVVVAHRGSSVSMRVRVASDPIAEVEGVVEIGELSEPVASLLIGNRTDTPGFDLHAFVLKEETGTEADWGRFFSNAPAYVHGEDHDWGSDTTKNSLLRFDRLAPTDVIIDHFIGGPGDRLAYLDWHPVAQDFALERGTIRHHPIKARWWKFEFSKLVPEVYESFIPQHREVRTFPTQATRPPAARGVAWTDVPGIATQVGLAETTEAGFVDSGFAPLLGTEPSTVAEVIAISDPGQAREFRLRSPQPGYEAWQPGGTIPSFVEAGTHSYDTQVVVHSSRVAYFVGLRGLTPGRSVPSQDDPERILERFFDDAALATGYTFAFDENRMHTHSLPGGFAESKNIALRDDVGAIQFATQQTDAAQIVPDHFFTDPTLNSYDWDDPDRWRRVGDAIPTWIPGIQALRLDRSVGARGETPIVPVPTDALYLLLPGTDGSIAHTAEPDPVTGHFVVGVRFAEDFDWTPAADGIIASQWGAAGDRGWFVRLNTTGRIAVVNSADGTAEVSRTTTVAVPDGTRCLHVDFDPAGATLIVKASPDYVADPSDGDDASYVQVGTTVSGTATTIFAHDAELAVGGKEDGTVPLDGNIERLVLTDSVDTLVDADYRQFVPGGAIGMDLTGFRWTIEDDAVIWGIADHLPHDLSYPILGVRERWPIEDPDVAENRTYGGICSPEVMPSEKGSVVAATRFTALTDLGSPVKLQILTRSGVVVAEKQITAAAGQTIEAYTTYRSNEIPGTPPTPPDYGTEGIVQTLTHLVPSPPGPFEDPGHDPWIPSSDDDFLRVQLLQEGPSDDQWQVDALSMFDDALVWEFSVDGGASWMAAHEGIRCNVNGMVSFPLPGRNLKWRVSSYRQGTEIDSLALRPVYVGRLPARPHGLMRGPNVSDFDMVPAIADDPEWKRWSSPVPRWWWDRYRQFPELSPIGDERVASFRARVASSEVWIDSGTVTREMTYVRVIDEGLDLDSNITHPPKRDWGIVQPLTIEQHLTDDEVPDFVALVRVEGVTVSEVIDVYTPDKVAADTFEVGDFGTMDTPDKISVEEVLFNDESFGPDTDDHLGTPEEFTVTETAYVEEPVPSADSYLDTTDDVTVSESADAPEDYRPPVSDSLTIIESASITARGFVVYGYVDVFDSIEDTDIT